MLLELLSCVQASAPSAGVNYEHSIITVHVYSRTRFSFSVLYAISLASPSQSCFNCLSTSILHTLDGAGLNFRNELPLNEHLSLEVDGVRCPTWTNTIRMSALILVLSSLSTSCFLQPTAPSRASNPKPAASPAATASDLGMHAILTRLQAQTLNSKP